MNPSYIARLLCLSLACFFLVHLALGATVAFMASRCLALADRMKPRNAARFLFVLRLLPACGALLAVIGICVPSYLWFEPKGASEDIGAACMAAALLGIVICGISIARAAGAVVTSRRFIRDCQQAGEKILIAGEPVWVVNRPGRIIALAGMLRPEVLISREVISRDSISALDAEGLECVLRHERAHAESHDNLKRLALMLAPDVLPFVRRGLATIEHAWAKFAEWAADDYAAMGDPERSMSLAAALVRVARIPVGAPTPAVLTPFIDGDFSARVDRLLLTDTVPLDREWKPSFSKGVIGATACLAAAIAFLLLRPAALLSAHELLERLIK
jgi:hypothetical protein